MADLGPEGANFGSWDNSRPGWANFGLEKADFGPEMADKGPENGLSNFGGMDGWMFRQMDKWTDGQIDRWMDRWMEIHHCVPQDISPLGSLPKKTCK